MSNIDPIQDLEYDARSGQYQYSHSLSWPIQQSSHNSPMLPNQNNMNSKRSTSPLPLSFESNTYHHTATYPPTTLASTSTPLPMMDPHQQDPSFQQQQQQHDQHHHHHQHHNQQQQHQWQPVSYPLDTSYTQSYGAYDAPYQTSPTDYAAQLDPSNYQANVNASIANTIHTRMALNDVYTTMAMTSGITAGMHPSMDDFGMTVSWPSDIPAMYSYDPSMMQQPLQTMGSPVAGSETYISDSLSHASWEFVEHSGAIFNPSQTLHPRTLSDSSSDNEHQSRHSMDGFVDVGSPSTDSAGELHYSDQDHHYSPPRIISGEIITRPIPVPQGRAESHSDSSPPQGSPVSSGSRGGRPRKSTVTSKAGTSPKGVSKKAAGDKEKRVGRRKGPLQEHQRKQASEIRKVGACIRCRFLKKTCDTGNPCAGCRPSHARLWMVPCTRIDIRDLGYFVKDWKADYERHVSLGFSIGNIKGFAEKETTLFITHGYGQFLPVKAREVYVRDDRVFGVDWVEADRNGVMSTHEVLTARMSIGKGGISTALINDYLDRHIDGDFEGFVDEFFMDSPFFPEILKTVYRFYKKEETPVIRTALKFVLAYNLTQAVCLVKPVGEKQENLDGAIPEDSYYHGNIAAPVMINFQIKCAMADQWRALQQEVLSELSKLYTSVYNKDKLKHWPIIFMIASVLLVVWEEMQFDCRFRVPDEHIVDKFCKEMIDIPVGVVVGLFSAISQKIPAFLEWETPKHKESLGSVPSVCQAMEEVRDEIKKHEEYLGSRKDAQFDRNDFDCLSNMFVSKLVIRAH